MYYEVKAYEVKVGAAPLPVDCKSQPAKVQEHQGTAHFSDPAKMMRSSA